MLTTVSDLVFCSYRNTTHHTVESYVKVLEQLLPEFPPDETSAWKIGKSCVQKVERISAHFHQEILTQLQNVGSGGTKTNSSFEWGSKA